MQERLSQEYLQCVCEAWLARFVDAVKCSDSDALANCLQRDGWLRDLLTFSWTFKSMQGRSVFKSYLEENLEKAEILDIRLDNSYPPRIGHFGPSRTVVDAALKFETTKAYGKGFVRISLTGDEDQMKKPEAFALLVTISDWKGCEELGHEARLDQSNAHTRVTKDSEHSPDVVIGVVAELFQQFRVTDIIRYFVVGAGQAGLQVAARFRQMRIKAILIEKDARIGDSWRRHYPTLTLHTPRMFNTRMLPILM